MSEHRRFGGKKTSVKEKKEGLTKKNNQQDVIQTFWVDNKEIQMKHARKFPIFEQQKDNYS